MKTLFVSALAFGAMTSVALAAEPIMPSTAPAEPVMLTDAEMDTISAGRWNSPLNIDVKPTIELPIALNVLTADSVANARAREGRF